MVTSNPEVTGDLLACGLSEALQREVLARTFKGRQPTPGQAAAFFPSHFSQCLTPATLIRPAQTSPRLVADPYLLASHASKMYQHAGLPSLQQSYMQYRLMPPVQQNPAQNFQAPLMLPNTGARVSAHSPSSSPRQTTSCGSSPVSKEGSAEDRDLGPEASRHDRLGYGKAGGDTRAPVNDRDSAFHKSRAPSPRSSDNPSPFGASKPPQLPHKRVPRLHVDLRDNVLEWNAEDVCHFVSSVTKSAEISQAFRDEHIDGHSLVLIQEEHLLNRMAIRLGPALKILAQINKLVENMENLQESNPA